MLKCEISAGIVNSDEYDFKGNLLHSRRQLAQDYKTTLDWSGAVALEAETYTTRTSYDALNRPLTVTTPDGSVYRPTFNEANLLDKVDVNLRGADTATPFVTNVNYNAKGQRELIAYGNGAKTAYEYDTLTFRLTRLRTTRAAALNGLASQIFADPAVVQDLRYTYDPAGNITRIGDAALLTIFHNGQQVEPVCDYTYDAIYRLIQASGREHIGQTAFDFDPPNGNRRDHPFAGLADSIAPPNDVQAMRNYTQQYEYDAVGNFEVLRHFANGGSWTRRYDYEEDSVIESEKQSNRLTRTRLGNGFNFTEIYTYTDGQGNDVYGCMTAINNMTMLWDFEDQLQQVGLGGGGTAYYVYDASGQRVRKVTERQNGTRHKERIYLDGFEVYHEYNGIGAVALERETLHVTDDKQRIALVETQTVENGNAVALLPVQRYQLGNHLGSASLELDKDGGLISYEEYHPYGTSSLQAMNSTAEVSLKRYRYTGKEKDEETGFHYHGARYYAPWVGRWTAADPSGLVDGPNLYLYARGSPVGLSDPNGNQSETDKGIAQMTDIDLHRALKALSPEGRAMVVGSASGKFKERASATLARGKLESVRTGVTEVEHVRPEPTKTQPYSPPLENVEHPEPWTPPAVVREAWETAIDVAANPADPDRAIGFLGAIGGFLPVAVETVVHGIIAAPQLAVTETIAAGEHKARADLLRERGADEAAVDEVLAMAESGALGIAEAANTVGIVAGAVKPKPPAAAPPPAPSPAPPPALVGYPYAEPPPWFYYRPPKPPIGFGRPPAPGGNPYAAPPPGVPVKPPIGFGRPPAPPIVSPSPKRIGFELPEEPPPPTQPRPTINQTR